MIPVSFRYLYNSNSLPTHEHCSEQGVIAMLIETIKCTYCAALLPFPVGTTSVDCSFCGQKVTAPPAPEDPDTGTLLRRGFIFLEAHRFPDARECFDAALKRNPEHCKAYVGLLCADLEAGAEDELAQGLHRLAPNEGISNYDLALAFADDEYRAALTGYARTYECRQVFLPLQNDYEKLSGHLDACTDMEDADGFTPPFDCRLARDLDEYRAWVDGMLQQLSKIADYGNVADILERGRAYSRLLEQKQPLMAARERTLKGCLRRLWIILLRSLPRVKRWAKDRWHNFLYTDLAQWLGVGLRILLCSALGALGLFIIGYIFVVTGAWAGIVQFFVGVFGAVAAFFQAVYSFFLALIKALLIILGILLIILYFVCLIMDT